MVKIPATLAGLPAITAAVAQGISVNVTLIFGVERYAQVQDAWLAGLEDAQVRGRDLSAIGSVASFFVSRLDTAVDGRLDAMADAGALEAQTHRELRGRAAVANARQAYRQYQRMLQTPRWLSLAAAGAQPQRPLWASTSTKDPTFSPTRYVDELVAPQTVNTMPSATLDAVVASTARHPVSIDATDEAEAADVALFERLAAVGVDYQQVVEGLEEAGVSAFSEAWTTLLELVERAQANGC